MFQTSTRVVLEVVSWMGTELWLHSVDKSLHSYPRNLEAWNYYLVKTANQINYHFNNLNFVQTSSRQENSQRRRDKEYYEATSEASKILIYFSFSVFVFHQTISINMFSSHSVACWPASDQIFLNNPLISLFVSSFPFIHLWRAKWTKKYIV